MFGLGLLESESQRKRMNEYATIKNLLKKKHKTLKGIFGIFMLGAQEICLQKLWMGVILPFGMIGGSGMHV